MRLVGLGSIVACTIVIASFAMFAVNQTSRASTHQQQTISQGTNEVGGSQTPSSSHTGVRKTVDEASEWLTSPFDGLTSGSHSEWAIRGTDLALALAIYGFGLGFLARSLRVRT